MVSYYHFEAGYEQIFSLAKENIALIPNDIFSQPKTNTPAVSCNCFLSADLAY